MNENNHKPGRPPSIPDHELLRFIGSGAYGDVWLARNLTGAYRAIKVVYRNRFENEKPFYREFEGIGKYEPVSRLHPSQLDILHVGNSPDKDHFYYIMELADDAKTGSVSQEHFRPEAYSPKTLKSELSRGLPLPLADCIDLGLSLTTALDNLHGHHLVHRDIKPSNIVYVNGEPKLADIGLVTSLSADRSMVGTPGYIPPEGPGTPQADLYGLGKTLYEAASGKDRQDFPEAPDFRDPDSSEDYLEFHAVLLKTCETAPRNRYATAQSMHADLALLKKGKSVKRLHWVERRLRVFKGIGMAAAILALLALSMSFYQVAVNKQTRRLSSELARSLYAADINLAAQAWQLGNLKAARDLIAKHGPASASKDVMGIEWRLLWTLCHKTQEAFALRASAGRVRALAPSPDGRLAAFVTGSGRVRLLNIDDRKELASLDALSGINTIAFSPNGKLLAAGGSDRSVHLVETKGWIESGKLGPVGGEISRVAFSPDGAIIAAAVESVIMLFDLHSNKQRTIADKNSVLGLAFSPDGKTLASYGGLSTFVRFWDPGTGESKGELEAHTAIILSIAFSDDGQFLASSAHDNRVKVWARDQSEGWTHRATFMHEALVRSLSFAPDSRLLATGGGDNVVRIWDVILEESVRTLRGHSGEVTSLGFAPGRFLISGSADETVRFWDPPSGPERNRMVQTGIVVNVSLSTDRNTLVSSDPNYSAVHVWNIPSQTKTHSFTGESGFAANAAISPDGKFVAIHRKDSVLQLWKLANLNTPLLTLENQHVFVGHNVAFSPDSRMVVFPSSPHAVTLWSVAANESRGQVKLTPPEMLGLAFSADGARLAIVSGGELTIWDVKTLTALRRIGLLGKQIRSVAFSPDGKLLALPTGETAIGIWDLEKNQKIASFDGHTSFVDTVAFSPDGKTLASGSYDGTVKLWSIAIKQSVATLRGHLGPVTALLFSADGSTFYSGSGDATVKLWPIAPFSEILAQPE